MTDLRREMIRAVLPLSHRMFRDKRFWAPETEDDRLADFIEDVVAACARVASETDTESEGETMIERIAKIESTMLGFEDHGILTGFVYLDYGSPGSQGAGGLSLSHTLRDGDDSVMGMDRFVESEMGLRRRAETAENLLSLLNPFTRRILENAAALEPDLPEGVTLSVSAYPDVSLHIDSDSDSDWVGIEPRRRKGAAGGFDWVVWRGSLPHGPDQVFPSLRAAVEAVIG